jgi:hypothetical protein
VIKKSEQFCSTIRKSNELPQNEDFETRICTPQEEPLQIIKPIKFIIPKEIQTTIQEDLNLRKAPAYDQNTESNAKKKHCPSNIHM